MYEVEIQGNVARAYYKGNLVVRIVSAKVAKVARSILARYGVDKAFDYLIQEG